MRRLVSWILLLVLIVSTFASEVGVQGVIANHDGNTIDGEIRISKHKITASELEKLRSDFGVSQNNPVTPQIINGHGTGLRAPTEEEWAEIPANAELVDSISSASTVQALSKVDLSTSPWFPPIGNQGSEGSCVTWAVGYYEKTFQEAKEHNWDLTGARWESGGYPTPVYLDKIISPDFIYHLINNGVDGGSSPTTAINLICSVGASSWAEMSYDPTDHSTWPSESAWREAAYYRGNSTGCIYLDVTSDSGIQSLKNWIASENLAVITIAADQYPGLTTNDVWTTGNYNAKNLNHENTIVGYDDNFAYIENGQATKGAFKIANSWGVGGWEKVADGFYWISYKAMSQRVKWVNFFGDRTGYVPTLTATFNIAHDIRDECVIEIGLGSHNNPSVTKRFNQYIDGGAQPFCDNNIVFDITDFKSIVPNVDGKPFFMKVYDGGTSTNGTILYFSVRDLVSPDLVSPDPPLPTKNSMNVFVDIASNPVPVLFEDGFESGSFGSWNGTFVTSGETVSVTNIRFHHGKYSAAFTSNGGGGYENAYCYRNVTVSEIYARGYFYVSQSGIDADNDRFFFIVFRASGNNGLAYAGWKRTGGVIKWCITTRDGTSYPDVFSSTSPTTGQWYCVELHWRKDPSAGLVEMWVDGSLVCSSTGKDSSTYGDAVRIQVGLGELYGCSTTAICCDCLEISDSYVDTEPYVPPPPPSIDFQDDFESASFSKWNGIEVTSGEPTSVIDTLPHHGSYSARFASNDTERYERICCYKMLTANELFARGYFYVSKSGISDNNDRFFFIVFRSGINGLAYAGWKQTQGVVKWCITMRDGTSYIDVFSSGSPLIGRWYSVELHFKEDPSNGTAELWVDGALVCSSSGRNTAVYGDISKVQLGIAEIYSCKSTTVYSDCVKVSSAYVDPEPAREVSSISISLSRNMTSPKLGTVIGGVLTPKRIGSNVILQYRAFGAQLWTNLVIIKTDASSKYSYEWFPTVANSYELKASWLGDANTLSAETKIVLLDCPKVLTSISISTSSSSKLYGLRVNATGRLADKYGNALRDEAVVLYYTFNGISDWVPIISGKTDNSGNYSIAWIPSATGCYILKAEWAGNNTHGLATATTTLSNMPYKNQVLSVESNSSTSQLTFNETDWSLMFSSTGPDGTKGYAKVTVAKDLILNPLRVRVYVDDAERDFNISSIDDSWLLIFSYPQSTHEVKVDLDITVVSELPQFTFMPLFMMIALLVAIVSRKYRGTLSEHT